jgi:hypothetical protein
MAALLAGQSVSEVAKAYSVPRGTVASWSSRLHQTENPIVSNTKKQEMGDLLLELLHKQVGALMATLDAVQDHAWIKQQNASDLAVFFGVNYDKLARMIEALNRAADDTATDD